METQNYAKIQEGGANCKINCFSKNEMEKSVSINLFLPALQNFSKSPFKLVDEINQGMDRYNEKMENDLLFALCEAEESSYFFLMTRKIVPDIEFTDNAKGFVIYNNVNEDAAEGFSNMLHGLINLKKNLINIFLQYYV